MPHIKAQQSLFADRVAHVKFVTAHGAGLNPDAEELAFDRIKHLRFAVRGGHHRVERLFQPLTRRHAINGRVFVAVWHPDIVHARRPKRRAHLRCNLARPLAVFDPEIADALVRMAKREVIVRFRMREKGRVEIKAKPLVFRPIDPRGEMAIFNLVTIRVLVGIKVAGVQVQPVFAGDHAVGKIQIGAQLIWRACPSGVSPQTRPRHRLASSASRSGSLPAC